MEGSTLGCRRWAHLRACHSPSSKLSRGVEPASVILRSRVTVKVIVLGEGLTGGAMEVVEVSDEAEPGIPVRLDRFALAYMDSRLRRTCSRLGGQNDGKRGTFHSSPPQIPPARGGLQARGIGMTGKWQGVEPQGESKARYGFRLGGRNDGKRGGIPPFTAPDSSQGIGMTRSGASG